MNCEINISLAKDPLRMVFAFEPGEKIQIHVNFKKFEESQIPDYYRLQILDHRSNSRLNRYGKGSTEIIVLDWPIPTTIRTEHLGVWQVCVSDKIDEKYLFSQFFFVEHRLRSEFPLLKGEEILQLPERKAEIQIPVQEEILVPQDERIPSISEIEPQIEEVFVSKIPVTEIRGIGKTYADRLAKISIYILSEFWYYPNREHLAETMRVTDKRLSLILQDAEILLSQEAETAGLPPKEEIAEVIPDDLLTISGISQTSVERLTKLGVMSKSDLLDYEDIETLRKALRMSLPKLEKILASIGRILSPVEVTEAQHFDPSSQPVINVKGVGPKAFQKLGQNGIVSVQDLLNADFSKLSGIPETSFNRWKKNAAILAGQQQKEIPPITKKSADISELTSIQGIGVKTAEKLKDAGVTTVFELSNYSNLDELSEKTKLAKKRLLTWQSRAKSSS